VWLGTFFLYYFLMEYLLGRTIGKWILGLKVTEMDGSKLTLRGAFVRTLLRLFDSENLLGALVGIACLLKTKRRQRLGDLAAAPCRRRPHLKQRWRPIAPLRDVCCT